MGRVVSTQSTFFFFFFFFFLLVVRKLRETCASPRRKPRRPRECRGRDDPDSCAAASPSSLHPKTRGARGFRAKPRSLLSKVPWEKQRGPSWSMRRRAATTLGRQTRLVVHELLELVVHDELQKPM